MKKRRFNVKNGLRQYIPSIFLLINEDEISWKGINKSFAKVFERRKREYDANGKELKLKADEVDFYTVIRYAHEGDKDDLGTFVLLNEIFISLGSLLSDREKRLVRKNVYDILTNIDRRYLNFVGELAVLNYLKKRKFTLLNIEEPLNPKLKNGTSADFLLYNTERKCEVLVEIVNVHLSPELIKDRDSIELLFKNKVYRKYDNTSKNAVRKFWLLPVLWGDLAELEQVNTYFDKEFLGQRGIFDPFCYMWIEDSRGYRDPKFGPLISLLS